MPCHCLSLPVFARPVSITRIGRRRQKSPSRCIFSADDLRNYRPQKVENADARRASADRLPSRLPESRTGFSLSITSTGAAFMNLEVVTASSLLCASSSSSLASPQMDKQTSSYVRSHNPQQVPQQAPQFARLPQATQRRDDRVEEIQENQQTDGSKCSWRLRALSWTQPSRVPPLPTFQTGHDRLKPVLLHASGPEGRV
jgi:hypothetical protein